MVAPDRSAVYFRELDLFSKKLGLDRRVAVYDMTGENELQRQMAKFFLELKHFPQHTLPNRHLG